MLVGDDPASAQYVALKQRNARQAGIDSEDHRLPFATTTDELLNLVTGLNSDDSVSAIIQQLAPDTSTMTHASSCLDPVKDVDGFHL